MSTTGARLLAHMFGVASVLHLFLLTSSSPTPRASPFLPSSQPCRSVPSPTNLLSITLLTVYIRISDVVVFDWLDLEISVIGYLGCMCKQESDRSDLG